jgi:hypothetical protein
LLGYSGIIYSQEIEGLQEKTYFQKATPFATYHRFTYSYFSKPLLNEQSVRVLDKTGAVVRTLSTLTPTKKSALPSFHSEPYLLWRDDSWLDVSLDTVLNGSEHLLRLYHQNELIDTWDLTCHMNDTLLPARLFAPDPLTPNNLSYGGIYKDMNDGNGSILDSLSIVDLLRVEWQNDTVRLRNNFVTIVDFDAPYIAPNKDENTWLNGRSGSQFEQVMVVYHITKQLEYLSRLGYDSIITYSIAADPQALNGQDNSLFNYGYNPPRLYFGEGGVDDAEDADVIIHELGHALSHGAAPGSNFGQERRTFDEALGDYFAERYGRRLGIYSTRVFDWDGNNEFWNGRSVAYDGSKNYPQLTFSGIYQHTDIICSAMLEFSQSIGVVDSVADQIILEAMHTLLPNQSLGAISASILLADSIVTGGLYQNQIQTAFGAPKNLLNAAFLPEEMETTQTNLYLRDGSWHLRNPSGENLELQGWTVDGRLLLTSSSSALEFNIPENVKVLKVTHENGALVSYRVP